MTKIPRAVFLLLLISVPALAQSPYSFDNFDTRNVKIYEEPSAIRASDPRRRRATSSVASASNMKSERTLVQPTVSIYDPVVTVASGAGSLALRGYTTGNAEIDAYVIASGTRNGVDPLLIYSVMHQESSFKKHAISPKGARGLMQLMPPTAARYGVSNIFDPKQNIEGGARYLRFLLDRFDGDLVLTLAGYNAGEGAVDKYGRRVPPYSETQEYVRRISRRYSILRDPNAALYAPRYTSGQLARLQGKGSAPLTVYERTVLTVRLPDGRLQLMSQ